jgi:hypothetical protein
VRKRGPKRPVEIQVRTMAAAHATVA